MDYLLKSNSWRIISEDLFIKIIDKSVLHNNGTGIPKELKSFFEIENLKNGDKRIITINYNNEEYYTRFEITSLNRARMMWKSRLANLLKNKLPVWYKKFAKDRNFGDEEVRPKLRLKKIKDDYYRINIIKRENISDYIYKDEIDDLMEVAEGRANYNYSKVYKRNKKLREKAIEYHGLQYVICGFDFEEHYGKRGEGYIEIHHRKPLSSNNEGVTINSVEDVVPVCSNFHKMIHREKDNLLSIKEMKSNYKDK